MKTDILESIDELNKYYDSIASMDRLKKLFEDFDSKEILVTTSFGISSAILLHMMSKVAPGHPIYFINTGYLFEQTLKYRDQLIEKFGINVVDVTPNIVKHEFTQENDTWSHKEELCCFVNKIEPMDRLKKDKKIWVSGLFRFQNANREKLRIFEPKKKIIKFHPIIDLSPEEVQLYSLIYELTQHPLLYQGYGSLGCIQCTSKGDGREGRWLNSRKTECGLHA